MAPTTINSQRRLTLIISSLTLVSNLTTTYLSHNLPDDPLHVASHLALYSYFASVLSVLGIVGAKKNNGTLVAIFANYLLIDVFITAIPRFLAISMFPEIRDSLCSADSVHAWLHSHKGWTDALLEDEDAVTWGMQDQCRRVVTVLQILVGLLAVAATLVQVSLALRVNRHAASLQNLEQAAKAPAKLAGRVWEKSPEAERLLFQTCDTEAKRHASIRGSEADEEEEIC